MLRCEQHGQNDFLFLTVHQCSCMQSDNFLSKWILDAFIECCFMKMFLVNIDSTLKFHNLLCLMFISGQVIVLTLEKWFIEYVEC